ncbi:hypothetical protein I203_101929 [Kwoniella mangroviensis CBS 8507]|uniref:uncharacterized protein n=1 Tax=Kwoniella mangroviensis CBS 8507 TaxID=1296122 RepID=UPI0030630A85
METSNNNNTTTDPFAPRLTPTLAPPPTSHTARSVSITMEDYITDGKDDQELDLNMVHDFGGAEGLGVDMRDFTNHDQDEDHDHKDSILG